MLRRVVLRGLAWTKISGILFFRRFHLLTWTSVFYIAKWYFEKVFVFSWRLRCRSIVLTTLRKLNFYLMTLGDQLLQSLQSHPDHIPTSNNWISTLSGLQIILFPPDSDITHVLVEYLHFNYNLRVSWSKFIIHTCVYLTSSDDTNFCIQLQFA